MMKKMLILVAVFVIFQSATFAQIIYNKSKPVSFKAENLTAIAQLPNVLFLPDKNGNFSELDLNISVKEQAKVEKNNEFQIARMVFHVSTANNVMT